MTATHCSLKNTNNKLLAVMQSLYLAYTHYLKMHIQWSISGTATSSTKVLLKWQTNCFSLVYVVSNK